MGPGSKLALFVTLSAHLASSGLFPHLSNGVDHHSPPGQQKESVRSWWYKPRAVNHWADASYNLDLRYLKPQAPKAFPEPLSSDDLTLYWYLETTQAAEGSASFQKGGVPGSGSHPQKVLGSRSTPGQTLHYPDLSGHCPVVRPSRAHSSSRALGANRSSLL